MEKSLIIQGEGYSSTVYKCTEGHPTIGYGHKLLPQEIGQLNEISQQQAQNLLDSQIQTAKKQIQLYFGAQLLNEIGQCRKAVLIDMAYNMGSVRWPKFTQRLKQKDYEGVANEIQNSKYRKQVKGRAVRNIEIMRSGKIMKKQQAQKIYNQRMNKMN